MPGRNKMGSQQRGQGQGQRKGMGKGLKQGRQARGHDQACDGSGHMRRNGQTKGGRCGQGIGVIQSNGGTGTYDFSQGEMPPQEAMGRCRCRQRNRMIVQETISQNIGADE
ncbi:hypothetical protein [Vibrio salinus]|uniref:hypothetical protein n=1 Tax=Vibrio salinus TaxID=2899784 RepID=UPI001E4FB62B|nr:hypothetical protein [Vibrio salinus]MCE0495489.1 hypothetical protein [Vibrio salinus]